MSKSIGSIRPIPATFAELCRQIFWARPLRDAVDYHNAAEVVDRLALLKRRTRDQEDYLEAISTFIEILCGTSLTASPPQSKPSSFSWTAAT